MTTALAALLLGAIQVAEPAAAPLLLARQEDFLEAWSAADEARRGAALRELERMTPPGAPAGAQPSARALGRAWRALVRETGAPDAALTALEILAESLELRAVPGVFTTSAQGEPLTVRVRAPEGLRPAGRLALELSWIAPRDAGGAAIPARASEAWPDAFTPVGFELFVRAPDGAAPGTWGLLLELHDGERRASVPPIDVECLAPGAGGSGDDARSRALRRELDAWRATGLPATSGLTAEALLDERGGRFEPFEAAGENAWVWRAEGELRAVAIVLSPAREAPLAPLCGVRGAAWREVAAAEGLLLVPWRAARRGAEGMLAGLPQLLESCAPGLGDAPRVLVARADSATSVALPAAERPPFDAWVLSWWGGAEPRLPWPGTPARVLRVGAPVAGEALSAATPLHVAQRGTGQVLLDDLLAPGWTRELAAGVRAGSRAR